MPKATRGIRVDTRLQPSDIAKLKKLSVASSKTRTEIVREAILWYLHNYELTLSLRRDSDHSPQLSKVADRICALLYKLGVDCNAMARFMWEMGDPDERGAFEECHAKAVKYMRNKMTREDKEASGKLVE